MLIRVQVTIPQISIDLDPTFRQKSDEKQPSGESARRRSLTPSGHSRGLNWWVEDEGVGLPLQPKTGHIRLCCSRK